MRGFLCLRWSRKSLSLKVPDDHGFTSWTYFLAVRSKHPAYRRAAVPALWKLQWVSSSTKAKQAVLHSSALCLSCVSQCRALLGGLNVGFWNYSLILKKLKIWLAISILKYEPIFCGRRAGEEELAFSVVAWLQL